MVVSLPDPWPTNPWPTRFRTVRPSEARYEPDGLRFLTVQSPALGGRGDLIVYVPPGSDSVVDLPIVVMLHGVYGSFWNWAFKGGAHRVLEHLVVAGAVPPMALVMPSDGLAGEGTAYRNGTDAEYESWIMHDVVDAATEMIPGIGPGSPLFLTGVSMGGYGAVRLGVRHADRVAAVSAHSPVPDLVTLSQFVAEPYETNCDDDLASMLVQAAVVPPLRFDCGTSDPLIDVNRHLHDTLVAASVDHGYDEFPGGHDWDYWHTHVSDTLRFLASVLVR